MAIKNEQYNQILRKYDSRRLANRHELDLRRNEVFAAIPKLQLLENEIISLSAQSGRKALFGDDSILKNLKEKTAVLKSHQTALLTAKGYPPDYLELHYQCNKCKDTGYIGNEKCTCLKQAIANIIYNDSNINLNLKKENFNCFNFAYYSDDYIDKTIGLSPLSNMQKIVAGCKNYIKHFDKKHDNLFLMGNTGVGKTFLANCIAKELLDRGNTVIYLTAFRLFDILEKHKFKKNEDNANIVSNQFNYILEADLMIIDDLGTELSNSFTTSQLYLVINERLLKQKSTLISTNLSLENLNLNYSERVYSRIISNFTIIRIIGEDIRLHKALMNSQ
jgi:DNA replication protein DnaC